MDEYINQLDEIKSDLLFNISCELDEKLEANNLASANHRLAIDSINQAMEFLKISNEHLKIKEVIEWNPLPKN